MKDYSADHVLNVCVMGPVGCGKTEILESILYNQKVVDRFGRNTEGNSIIDSDPEEVKRGMSVYTHLVPVEWSGKKINFLDAPGYLDFVGEMDAALAVCETALIVVNAKEGVQPAAMRAYNRAVAAGKNVIFFVTRCDEEHAKYEETVLALVEHCEGAVPVIMPVIQDGTAVGIVDVITQKDVRGEKETDVLPEYAERVQRDHATLVEAIAMTSDELTEKYLMEEPFTQSEIIDGMKAGIASGTIKPIICGSAEKFIAIEELLDVIVFYTHPYVNKETVAAKDSYGNDIEVKTAPTEPFSGLVFKTVNDAFATISYIKVMSGTLTTDTPAYNTKKDEPEKIGSIITLRGKNQEKVTKLEAGDIGAILKLQDTQTNDTLATKNKPVIYPDIQFTKGMLGKAIWPKTKNDEDKMSQGLSKLLQEDLTYRLENNSETKEQVLYGVGDQHIDILVSKLKSRYKVEVTLTEPKVQYRETIQIKVEVQGKHKKQSGGAGQYGDVWIRFEPNPDQDEMVFEEAVVGGAVPKQYFPAVEDGLREAMQKGVLAGYKVVQVKATLYDGSYHPVDSKEIAFKAAARLAYKAGMQRAKPTLLEPIVRAEVLVPGDYVGAIYGDFSKRRGVILENNAVDDDAVIIVAEVPQSEMMSYATELRSMTQGNGSYNCEFIRYEKAPQMVIDKVVAAAKVDLDED